MTATTYRITRTYRTVGGTERVYHYEVQLAATRLAKAIKAGVTFRPTKRPGGFWDSGTGLTFRSEAVHQIMRRRVGYYDGKVLRRMA